MAGAVIIGGMAGSMLLTLLVIPAIRLTSIFLVI
jgi:multidrug efflux pump subunit AcrB